LITSDDLRRDSQPVSLTQVPPAQVKRMKRRLEDFGLHIENDEPTRDEEEAIVLLFQHTQ